MKSDIISGGSVAEWLKAHDSKSCGRVNRLGGSNPLASAKKTKEESLLSYFVFEGSRKDNNPLASAICSSL